MSVRYDYLELNANWEFEKVYIGKTFSKSIFEKEIYSMYYRVIQWYRCYTCMCVNHFNKPLKPNREGERRTYTTKFS